VKFDKLECVVLAEDIPGHGLRTGDLGTVVEVYSGGGVESPSCCIGLWTVVPCGD
jgi:hypothetical protein